jgi:hypothetical protein
MDYLIKIQNVKTMVAFVNEPRGKGGYSYTLNFKSPVKEIEEYLDGKYKSIYLQTYDEKPRYTKGQDITIAELGISSYEDKEGNTRYSAHIVEPKPSLKTAYEQEMKDVIKPEEKKKEQELIHEVIANERADKDASIVAQVLCKVKGMAGGYKDSGGVVIPNINEEIYNDYIFFSNRVRKNGTPF